jgi:hypothetical protein
MGLKMQDEKTKLEEILGHVENMIKIFGSNVPDVEFVKKIGRMPTKEEQKLLESTRANYIAKLEDLKTEILKRL